MNSIQPIADKSSENAELDSSGNPHSQFVLVPLAGDKSPFCGIKPLSALLTLADMRDFANGISKQHAKDVANVWDWRGREKLAVATGQNVSTISKQWAALEQAGLLEQGSRQQYRTTPRRLTTKAWDAWNTSEKIHVQKAFIDQGENFGTLLVLAYVSYRAGATATNERYKFGYCSEGTRAIAEATGLARNTVRAIFEKLLDAGVLVREMETSERGEAVPVISFATRSSGSISPHCATGQYAEGGGSKRRAGWGNLQTRVGQNADTIPTVSRLQSNIQSDPPAADGCSSPGGGVREQAIDRLPPAIQALCAAIAKRAKYISFNHGHPEWFQRLRLTAALVELQDRNLLSENKLSFSVSVGIEPFTTSLQSNLVSAFCKMSNRTDVLYPEKWFKKLELEQEYGKQAVEVLYKSDFRKLIDEHFEAILLRLAELSELKDSQPARSAISETKDEIPVTASVSDDFRGEAAGMECSTKKYVSRVISGTDEDDGSSGPTDDLAYLGFCDRFDEDLSELQEGSTAVKT